MLWTVSISIVVMPCLQALLVSARAQGSLQPTGDTLQLSRAPAQTGLVRAPRGMLRDFPALRHADDSSSTELDPAVSSLPAVLERSSALSTFAHGRLVGTWSWFGVLLRGRPVSLNVPNNNSLRKANISAGKGLSSGKSPKEEGEVKEVLGSPQGSGAISPASKGRLQFDAFPAKRPNNFRKRRGAREKAKDKENQTNANLIRTNRPSAREMSVDKLPDKYHARQNGQSKVLTDPNDDSLRDLYNLFRLSQPTKTARRKRENPESVHNNQGRTVDNGFHDVRGSLDLSEFRSLLVQLQERLVFDDDGDQIGDGKQRWPQTPPARISTPLAPNPARPTPFAVPTRRSRGSTTALFPSRDDLGRPPLHSGPQPSRPTAVVSTPSVVGGAATAKLFLRPDLPYPHPTPLPRPTRRSRITTTTTAAAGTPWHQQQASNRTRSPQHQQPGGPSAAAFVPAPALTQDGSSLLWAVYHLYLGRSLTTEQMRRLIEQMSVQEQRLTLAWLTQQYQLLQASGASGGGTGGGSGSSGSYVTTTLTPSQVLSIADVCCVVG